MLAGVAEAVPTARTLGLLEHALSVSDSGPVEERWAPGICGPGCAVVGAAVGWVWGRDPLPPLWRRHSHLQLPGKDARPRTIGVCNQRSDGGRTPDLDCQVSKEFSVVLIRRFS